ncbi:hypothetical protein ACQ3G6_17360 [Allorhizobium undicola]|uniref:hypothetical protein n=1 Tax=Allorhizobium undicola TaxID=78527 RepID=UPI003D3286FD
MTQLSNALTPATAVAILAERGIKISERTLRERARQLGACREIGKALFLMPADIETILDAAKPHPKHEPIPCPTSPNAAKSGGIRSPFRDSDIENLRARLIGPRRSKSPSSTKPACVVPLSTAKKPS